MLKKGDKKLIDAWTFYDWANSVYPLVITTAVFPIFYDIMVGGGDTKVNFLGAKLTASVLYEYSLSFSFLMVALMSPVLSSIADYTGNKKKFLYFFCLLGSISVMMLSFFTSVDKLWLGITFSILASIGFWGSLVFYNAYLPEVAYPKDHDRVSAKGYIKGYLGSVILLIFILAMMIKPQWFGFIDRPLNKDEAPPTKVFQTAFILVGLWWLLFAQYTLRILPNNTFNRKPEKDFISKGFKELNMVWQQVKKHPSLKVFLYSFFMFSSGVHTIIVLAAIFGKKELGIPTQNLITTILLIQLVAIVGAKLFSSLSKKYGNIKILKLTLIIWVLVSFAASILPGESPHVNTYFYTLGAFLGLVLGATQTLARSTYSKLLPEDTHDNATFFSFFDVTEKLAIVFGTFTFALLETYTHSMRTSVLILSVYFFIGFVILFFMKKTKYVK